MVSIIDADALYKLLIITRLLLVMIKPNKTLLMTVTEVMNGQNKDYSPKMKVLQEEEQYKYVVKMFGNKIHLYEEDGSKLVVSGEFVSKDQDVYKDMSVLASYKFGDNYSPGGRINIYRGGKIKLTEYGSGRPIISVKVGRLVFT